MQFSFLNEVNIATELNYYWKNDCDLFVSFTFFTPTTYSRFTVVRYMFKRLEFLSLHNSHFKASLTQNFKAARLQIILSRTSFFFFLLQCCVSVVDHRPYFSHLTKIFERMKCKNANSFPDIRIISFLQHLKIIKYKNVFIKVLRV